MNTHAPILAASLAIASLAAGVPQIDWSTIDAGGATSTGIAGASTLEVQGTIGQFDVGQVLTGFSGGQSFSLVGGYWADARCPADFNSDQSVDFFDYLDFAAAFDLQDPSADFNQDGIVDFFDYLDFAGAFDSGC